MVWEAISVGGERQATSGALFSVASGKYLIHFDIQIAPFIREEVNNDQFKHCLYLLCPGRWAYRTTILERVSPSALVDPTRQAIIVTSGLDHSSKQTIRCQSMSHYISCINTRAPSPKFQPPGLRIPPLISKTTHGLHPFRPSHPSTPYPLPVPLTSFSSQVSQSIWDQTLSCHGLIVSL